MGGSKLSPDHGSSYTLCPDSSSHPLKIVSLLNMLDFLFLNAVQCVYLQSKHLNILTSFWLQHLKFDLKYA